MVDILAELPSQRASSNRERWVDTKEGRREVLYMTCFATSANYCLNLTGRVPREGLEQRINDSVDEMVSYRHSDDARRRTFAFDSEHIGEYLVVRNRTPILSLTLEEGRKPTNWRDQLKSWVKAGGVGIVIWENHARVVLEDKERSGIVLLDPLSESDEANLEKISVDDIPEEAFGGALLIPPKPEDCSAEIIGLIKSFYQKVRPVWEAEREQERDVLDLSDLGADSKKTSGEATVIGVGAVVPMEPHTRFEQTLEILWDEYVSKEGVLKIKPYEWEEIKGLPVLRFGDVDRDGLADVRLVGESVVDITSAIEAQGKDVIVVDVE